MELKEKPICCNEEMLYLGMVDCIDMNTNFIYRYVCKKCFRIIDIVDYGLDDEELDSLKGYNDELSKAIDTFLLDEKKEAKADLIKKNPEDLGYKIED